MAKPLAPAVEEGYAYPFRSPTNRTAPLALARLMRPARESQLAAFEILKPELKKIRAKVQILWGERDPLFRGKLLPYLLRDSLPNCGEPVFVCRGFPPVAGRRSGTAGGEGDGNRTRQAHGADVQDPVTAAQAS